MNYFNTLPSRVRGNHSIKIPRITNGHTKPFSLSISKFIITFYTLFLKFIAIKFDNKNLGLQI
ncbi:hypothetical protein GQ41_2028 [Arenibacter algicola]|uniref:Uncharacterized protein n=1 Tax=Arenibacter algicola TaxID=616991 RepID=A0ABY3AEC9_9FLAO